MDNYDIAELLSLCAKLTELHGGNEFKARAYSTTAFNLKKYPSELSALSAEELAAAPVLGKGILPKVNEILTRGSFTELEDLLKQTPPGILEMMRVKGIGPKKIRVIWQDMGIDNVSDLLDACRENRLVEVKGFGLKTQQETLKQIEFLMGNSGKFRYANIEHLILQLETWLNGKSNTAITGKAARRCEVLDGIDLVVAGDTDPLIGQLTSAGMHLKSQTGDACELIAEEQVPVRITSCTEQDFPRVAFESAAAPEHLKTIGYRQWEGSEEKTYASLGFPLIVPEMREAEHSADFLKLCNSDSLISENNIRGIIHNHSRYSDGLNTVEEMAAECRRLGYGYFGIADHSRSATYANGLQPERLEQQWKEIDALNQKMAPFRIFKGIESDILGDGSLDYPEEILKQFDYVVASVHSNLKMNEEKAHQRLIRAIENPYTNILGHPTGRLLLAREGYPIDHRYIIDACAQNGVAIELNANPYRLDIDWRWIAYCMEKGVMISINPDAHELAGILDVHYGVLAARKGGLTRDMTLNALSADEFASWLGKKSKK